MLLFFLKANAGWTEIFQKKEKSQKDLVVDYAFEVIKMEEGFSHTPYTCPSGIRTIGYGTTNMPPYKQWISQKEAEALAKDRIKGFYDILHTEFPHFEVWQYVALVDMIYNMGWSNFAFKQVVEKNKKTGQEYYVKDEKTGQFYKAIKTSNTTLFEKLKVYNPSNMNKFIGDKTIDREIMGFNMSNKALQNRRYRDVLILKEHREIIAIVKNTNLSERDKLLAYKKFVKIS